MNSENDSNKKGFDSAAGKFNDSSFQKTRNKNCIMFENFYFVFIYFDFLF